MLKLPPHQLANASKEDYMECFGELYEHTPEYITAVFEEVKNNSKYDDIQAFHQLLAETMLTSSDDLKTHLIQAHPQLAGKLMEQGSLTDFSTDEQKSAGLNQCTADELAEFRQLNQQYSERFGFPFIMAVKGKSKEIIKQAFIERLQNDLADERQQALEQINKIAWLRLSAIYPF